MILDRRKGRSLGWDLLWVDECWQLSDGNETLFATRCIVYFFEHFVRSPL